MQTVHDLVSLTLYGQRRWPDRRPGSACNVRAGKRIDPSVAPLSCRRGMTLPDLTGGLAVPQSVGEASASRRRAIRRLSHDAPDSSKREDRPARVRKPQLRNRHGSIDAREASHHPRAVLVSNFLRVCAAILLASAWLEIVPRPRGGRRPVQTARRQSPPSDPAQNPIRRRLRHFVARVDCALSWRSHRWGSRR
jgi:hypothetical protein